MSGGSMAFVGRTRELELLRQQLQIVREGRRADAGVALLVRGRRRVGKSRLVNEFVTRQDVPHVYFQAARGASVAHELALLARTVADSDLPGAHVADGNTPASLTAALTLLAAALPDTPSVVVLDEVPWLLEGIAGGAGELQRVWDNHLSRKPVLLLLLGSDLALMQHLNAPDQPFHGRATEMVLDPLNPADVAEMTGLAPYASFDAYLVTGGLPLIAQEWRPDQAVDDFLAESFASSTSALVVAGARVLDSEFGEATLARQVLTAIGGGGERTFGGIQRAARGEPLNASSLTASLRVLQAKRLVVADQPLSARPAPRDRRYRIADPALRFWLAFVEPALAEVDRGRPDLALARVRAGFSSWRGRAIEPVVRAALERLLPNEAWPDVRAVGGWWPRTNNPDVDLVGAGAGGLPFVGTVKWRPTPVTSRDVDVLAAAARVVPGADDRTALVAVCPGGAEDARLRTTWTAADLLGAWS